MMTYLNDPGISKATLVATTAALATVASGTAAVWCGFVPLYNVSNISVTRSNKATKFRAKHSFFFAYQAGEYEGTAIDVTCELTGPLKWMYYMALKGLFAYSRAQSKTDYWSRNTATGVRTRMSGYAPLPIRSASVVPLIDTAFFNTQSWSIASFNSLEMSQINEGKTVTQGNYEYYKRNVVFHKTFPFVSKDEVLLSAYLESIVERREARTNDKIVIDLFIREFRKENEWEELVSRRGYGGRSEGIKGRVNIINNYQLWLLMNTMMTTASTAFEVGRISLMRRVNPADILLETPFVFSRMWGSEPMPTDTITDLEPNISINDPLDPEDSEEADVTSWYYFNFNDEEFPIEKSIDAEDFEGTKSYHLLFYLVDDAPRDQLGFYERTTYVMCIVKDEDENITDRFRIDAGLIYRIGDGNIKICFDQVNLRYLPEFFKKIGHTITGRWTYESD